MELLSPLLLTLNNVGGRILAKFREEEHPRDKEGKFKENGNGILKIETNNSTKIVITSGTYENPKAKSIYSFKNNEDMLDFIKELENYEK